MRRFCNGEAFVRGNERMSSEDPAAIYIHIRIALGMVAGLGLTHLFHGIAQVVVHPERKHAYWIHLVWTLSMVIYFLHFWWWELRLGTVQHWTVFAYLFLVLYALLLYLLAALLFPESMVDYKDYKTYFFARRGWFFAIMATTYAIDFIDTWMKGSDYFASLGPEYIIRNISYMVLCIVAASIRNVQFHGTFAVMAVIYQISWISRAYYTLS
jgi:hypothetical protein